MVQCVFERLKGADNSPAAQRAFLKFVMHQVLSNGKLGDQETQLVINSIVKTGITLTIDWPGNAVTLDSTKYQLSSGSQANLRRIINEVIKQAVDPLIAQYRTYQPLFPNSGATLPVAKADIKQANSIVDKTELSSDAWQLSVMHLSDDHQTEGGESFLVLEQRGYAGEHIIHQIVIKQDGLEKALEKKTVVVHPNQVDTSLRAKIFGEMAYDAKLFTKPRYYGSSFTLRQQQGEQLLSACDQQGAISSTGDNYTILHNFAASYVEAGNMLQSQLSWEAYLKQPEVKEYKKDELLQVAPSLVRKDSEVMEIRRQEEILREQKAILQAHKDKIGKTEAENVPPSKKGKQSKQSTTKAQMKRDKDWAEMLQKQEEILRQQEAIIIIQKQKGMIGQAEVESMLQSHLEEYFKKWETYLQQSEAKSAEEARRMREEILRMQNEVLQAQQKQEERLDKAEKAIHEIKNILEISGVKDHAEIKGKLEAYKNNEPALFSYCTTFIWVLKSYMDAYAVASSRLLATNQESSTAEDACFYATKQAVKIGVGSVPFLSSLSDILTDSMDEIRDRIKEAKQDNKIEAINAFMRRNHTLPSELEGSLARAAISIVERKGETIKKPVDKKSNWVDEQVSKLREKIDRLTIKLLKTKALDESPQATMAVEDVIALMARLYKQYESIQENRSGAKFHEQVAELVCKGSLEDLIAQEKGGVKTDLSVVKNVFSLKELQKLKKKATRGLWVTKHIPLIKYIGKECEEYFKEKYIKTMLEKANLPISNDNILAVRMRLFEAMCEGIASSAAQAQALTCATKFGEVYPRTAELIAIEFPDFFKNQAIAKSCIIDDSGLPDNVRDKLSKLP